MPKTEDTEAWLDSLDPAAIEWRDAAHFRAIRAANDVIRTGENALVQAVIAARTAGDSWTIIGAALGVSKQAASERFGKAVKAFQTDAA